MKLQMALKQGAELLAGGGVPSPRLNAEVLLMHAARCDRAHLYAHGERELTDSEWVHYGRYLKERLEGKPTQYITGHQEFWGLDFLVNPSVLVPRPETEVLVEVALEIVREKFPDGCGCIIADVGTGSGCIAIALATELPKARIVALEQSPEALETARFNAARLSVESRITFHRSDLLHLASGAPLPPLQLVVSNPPYVSTKDEANVMPEVSRYEPPAAVFAGPSGLEAYARLIPQAADVLAAGEALVLELGYDVEEGVRKLLASGEWEEIAWRKDLAGITRVVSARRTWDAVSR
ncbi:MAG: peptide chain release factor N(5)-glutamine methyltransferase [Acidobacteria bacterium]|nr:peptide chain release factor N(5)-glutamine methyltransferase [Acidobacteriota bacterium]